MVDPSLNGVYAAMSLSNFADIISRCLQVSFYQFQHKSQVAFFSLFHKIFLSFCTLVTLWLANVTNVTNHNVTQVLPSSISNGIKYIFFGWTNVSISVVLLVFFSFTGIWIPAGPLTPSINLLLLMQTEPEFRPAMSEVVLYLLNMIKRESQKNDSNEKWEWWWYLFMNWCAKI